jgi:hypothetical protein
MIKKFIHLSVFVIAFSLVTNLGFGQNNTSSPYTKFGIGDLASIGYGRNLALGGTGYGLRSPLYLNPKNPASLTAIDSLSFLFETGVHGKYTISTTIDHSQDYWDGNLTHISMGHRYTPWLMGSYGLLPYTNIGYNLRTLKNLESETTPVYTDWNGTGGINKIFYAVGLKLNRNFSLGGEVAYYYGPINEKRTTRAVVQYDNPTYYTSNTRYWGISYKGAMQFSANLDKKGSNLTIGGSFSPSHYLRGKSEILILQQYGTTIVDSMHTSETTATPILVPMNYGAGLAFTIKGKYLIAADYEAAFWSANKDKAYIDQTIYSFGIERLPQNSFNYFDRCSYRIGFRYDSGYVNTKGYNIDDMRFSLGIGLPLQKSGSTVNLTMEAGQRGTTQMGLIQEQYLKMTVGLSFHDIWFVKRKLN